jgi:hypothetical protein
LDHESNESIFYFAYGSNADPERFKARVGPSRSRRRARLQGYRLRFARMVQSEGGGGAVVDESPGAYVDGDFSAPSEAYLGHILRGLEAAGYGEAALASVRAAAQEAAKAD